MLKLDQTDYKILEILKDDARTSYSDIAEEVHLSRVAVRDRILQLQKNNVILGFTVLINSNAYGRNCSLFFDIEVDPHEINAVAKKLAEQEDVAIVAQHSGITGLHVHAYIPRIEMLADYMEKHLYSIPGIRSIKSHILIRNYKTTAYLTSL